jgi:PPM family protein phosphatase
MMNMVRRLLKRISGMRFQVVTTIRYPASGVELPLLSASSGLGLTRVLQPAYTMRLRPDPAELPDREAPRPLVVPPSLAWHGATDQGRVRDHNEDNFTLLNFADKALMVVADGMGGHDSGEVASKLAMETVLKVVQEEHPQAEDLLALMERAVQQANAAVWREGAARGSNMGTTLGAALLSDGAAYIANVGDSRAYWIENGCITQVTTDHSLVAKLVSMGKLTRKQAREHPKANLLYRTIGTDETVRVDTFRIDMKKGGALLLCTDGLWGEVSDEMIHRVCSEEKDVREACERLVRMANENGGKDNITAVVARVL